MIIFRFATDKRESATGAIASRVKKERELGSASYLCSWLLFSFHFLFFSFLPRSDQRMRLPSARHITRDAADARDVTI